MISAIAFLSIASSFAHPGGIALPMSDAANVCAMPSCESAICMKNIGRHPLLPTPLEPSARKVRSAALFIRSHFNRKSPRLTQPAVPSAVRTCMRLLCSESVFIIDTDVPPESVFPLVRLLRLFLRSVACRHVLLMHVAERCGALMTWTD